MTRVWLLVDGNNIASTAEHAALSSHAEMSVDGISTASMVLFHNMLERAVRISNAKKVVVVWDAGDGGRKAIYPAYKAARHSKGHSRSTFDMPKRLLDEFGIPSIQFRDYEADDVLSMMAHVVNEPATVLTNDKDLLQLVSDRVTIQKSNGDRWGPTQVREKYQVDPEQFDLYLALVGDQVDGVPGIPGIGPVKARKMLSADHSSDLVTDEFMTMLCLVSLHPDCYSLADRLWVARTADATPSLAHLYAYRQSEIRAFAQTWQMSKLIRGLDQGCLLGAQVGEDPAWS